MKPQVVGSACHRVQQALEEALAEGVLHLPPELEAHAARCRRCGPEWKETAALLNRLRAFPAGVDLKPVPAVVDRVLSHVAAEGPADPAAPCAQKKQRKMSHLAWVARQVAAVAAVLLLLIGGVTYTILKVNEAVSGVSPAQVVEQAVQPLLDWTQALFRDVN